MKKFARDIIILHMFQKSHPNDPKYQNFEKKMKKMPRGIILLYIHVSHKPRSYDIWFLKHKV